MSLLEAKNLTIRFGGLTAVHDFNVCMESGDLVGLIGPNGAGKSTCFNMLCGFYKPTEGSIRFRDHDIAKMKPNDISRLGLVRVFQNGRLFKKMNVIDNMLIGQSKNLKANLLDDVFRTARYNHEDTHAKGQAHDLLDKLGLLKYAYEEAGKLPFGIQRKLEVARALNTQPSLILLDEPVAGLNIEETNDMMDFVNKLRNDFGLTILLIEHTMRVVMSLCPQIIVINYGETIACGTPDEIRANQKVIDAYLGGG